MEPKGDSINHIIVKEIAGEQVSITESRAIPVDEFTGYYGAGDVLKPIYNPEQLIRLSETSDILQQCIEAYKTNIVGFGYNVNYDEDYDKLDGSAKTEADLMWNRYQRFFQYCNFDESFIEIMKKMLDDREKIGYGCLEVIEDGTGKPAGLEHVQAHKVRLCPKDKTFIDVPMTVLDEYDKPVTITIRKRFRRFVQIVNEKRVYFKEFGDPRLLDYRTGEFSDDVAPECRASSMIFFNIYCPYSEYGLPRYMGQLLNLMGNRKAEELNYRYFLNGRHIPLAVVVENGKLTPESIENLEKSTGNVAQHKFLLLEAEGLEKDVSLAEDNAKSVVKIRLEKLVEIMEKDGLFQEYCNNNRSKIRSAYRLHPIYTGESQDYTRATADTARQVTEEQVFQPEREDLQFKLNNILKPALEITGVSLEFKSPKLSNKLELAQALTPYITGGAATPNMLIDALGDLLGKSFDAFEEPWANLPIILAMQEYQQQNANPGTGAAENAEEITEVVGALKSLQKSIQEATDYD